VLGLQRGKFDAPDRTFASLPSSYRSVRSRPRAPRPAAPAPALPSALCGSCGGGCCPCGSCGGCPCGSCHMHNTRLLHSPPPPATARGLVCLRAPNPRAPWRCGRRVSGGTHDRRNGQVTTNGADVKELIPEFYAGDGRPPRARARPRMR